jgi:O-antigen biosynthesis protein
MLSPIKVVDIELSQPLPLLRDLAGYISVQALVRLQGVPLGYIKAPISNGQCTPQTLGQLILDQYSWAMMAQHCKNALRRHATSEATRDLASNIADFDFAQFVASPLPDRPTLSPSVKLPSVTIAVCTRDRVADLALCLDALQPIDYPDLEILVIDNAPSQDATQRLIAQQYPHVRYICEPRPGLNWARNRAIVESQCDIVAYADDDVVVDASWVQALAQVFGEYPEVMAVTGLVVPYELETDAQVLFEMNGGFGKGFERQRYYVPKGDKIPWYRLGTGNFGTGANMAYRRSVFAEIGGFNPALDVGTVTNGAGDLEMFFRVLKAGHPLVYEPQAIIRHRHRREYAQLKSQLRNNGSVFAYFICAAKAYPEQMLAFGKLAVLWLASWHLRRVTTLALYPTRFPWELAWAELEGCWAGLGHYGKAYKNALNVDRNFSAEPRAAELQALFPQYFLPRQKRLPASPLRPAPSRHPASPLHPASPSRQRQAMAVRSIELTEPLRSLTDVTDYPTVRVFVNYRGCGQGHIDIQNHYQPVPLTDLIQAIVRNLWEKLLWPDRKLSAETRWHLVCEILRQHYLPSAKPVQIGLEIGLPEDVAVSVIVGTCDRPDDLRNCLQALCQQETPRPVEIIVVDNHPRSGLTAPVVAAFKGVKLIEEPRQGVAYARNAGIVASCGEIIITTDDDVTMSPQWLEKLITPFARADVMGVTGNILPVELETGSQQFFEHYGGLGRGFHSFEVNGDWFERSWLHVVPTWELGGTANAAFRAQIFQDRQIGLMDEPLGPGMPSGVGEDIYLFYKILKAGYTIVYRGDAHVWHRHRTTMTALRRQLFNYSKGFVSYNLTTLIKDKDLRVLSNFGFYLPLFHLKRIYDRLRGRSAYPIGLTLVEIAGNLTGPIALWRSYQRVKRDGRSLPYKINDNQPDDARHDRLDPPTILDSTAIPPSHPQSPSHAQFGQPKSS